MSYVIGVLGGMGTYATIHLFQQYAEIFHAEKEWERPRIIIDNRCTMPSRVRAFLYNENNEQLVNEMTESIQNLIRAGCNRILLACNTSHLFLPKIYERDPEIEKCIVNIIDVCVDQCSKQRITELFLLGSEGTIESGVYNVAMNRSGIKCYSPTEDEYYKIRECIEAVKQNKYSDIVKNIFLDLINQHKTCLLGCTELPILYERYKNEVKCESIIDPIFIALEEIYKEYEMGYR